MSSRTPAILLLGLCLGFGACTSTASGPGARDPERMSESEYDIARDLWLRRNQPREALSHALKAVDLNEDNSEATHLVALIYLDFCSRGPADCRLPDAEKYARRSLEIRPDFREAMNTLGVVLIHSRKAREAVNVLKPLTEDILYPTPENAWGNLGWAYLELGSFDLAIDALKRSIAAQPLFCVGNFRLGLAYERTRDFASAVDAFTRALETEAPGCNALQVAFLARARTRMKLGEADAARADLDSCLELSRKTEIAKECGSMLRNFK